MDNRSFIMKKIKNTWTYKIELTHKGDTYEKKPSILTE